MSKKRASTSADPQDEPGVLDFNKLLAKAKRPVTRSKIENEEDHEGSSRTEDSSDSSSLVRKEPKSISQSKNKTDASGKITGWATTASRGNVSRQLQRSPIKSPKKSPRKSSEKGTSPLKGEVRPLEIDSFDAYQFNVGSPFLVKRPPEVGGHSKEGTPLRTKRKRREASPVFPPGERTLLPLCVLQREPEPKLELEELTELLKIATEQIKGLTDTIKQKEDLDCIESVLARGLLATNNKPIFKKVLRWTMKNCREDMVKKIEKKLGLKLKKKTREEMENFVPELPAINKSVQKAAAKKAEDEDVDETLFPNLMVNRVLMRMAAQAEEKCRPPPPKQTS